MLKWLEELNCTQSMLAKRCSQNKIGKMMLWCGSQLFGYMVVWSPPPDDRLKVIHFAVSETDMNNSTRTYVESLDEGYKK